MKEIIFVFILMIISTFIPAIIFANGKPFIWQCPAASTITNNNGKWIINRDHNPNWHKEFFILKQPNSQPTKLIGGSLYPLPDPYIEYKCRYEMQNNQVGIIRIESDEVSFAPPGKLTDETACIYGHNTPTFKDPATENCGAGENVKGSLIVRCLMTCQAI